MTADPVRQNVTLRALWPWIGLVVALITLPYLVVWTLTPDGLTFLGALVNPDDVSVYLSAMRQGEKGLGLFRFNFSPEPLPPSFMYGHYLLMGWVAGWIGGSRLVWFHGFRLLSAVFTLWGFLFWARQVWPHRRRLQLTTWFLIVFGTGVGWMVAIIFQPDFKQLPDVRFPEWNVMLSFLNTPHFALAWGFEAVLMGCIVALRRTRQGVYAVGGALAGIGLAMVYSFKVGVVGLVAGSYMVLIAVRLRRIPWRDWLNVVLVLLPLLPFLFYYGYWIRRDPIWNEVQFANNVITPPQPWAVGVALGLVGVLALFGARRWRESGGDWLVPLWTGINLLVLYVPFPFSGRFALGLMIPVATLAALGLETAVLPSLRDTRFFNLLCKTTPTPYETLRRITFILATPSTILVLVSLLQVPVVRPDFPLFLPQADMAAVEWLAETADSDDLILTHYPAGNVLPRYSSSRVFVGQTFLTVNREDKIAALATFWDGATSDASRRSFIEQWGIDYVYWGSYEQALTQSRVTPPGELVYDRDGVKIYRP